MAGDYSAVRWLQIGNAGSSVTGTVGTGGFVFVDAQGALFPNAQVSKIPVDVERDDGDISKPVVGPKSGGLTFTTLLRSDGDTTGAAKGPTELDTLLEALCEGGAAATNDTEGAGADDPSSTATLSVTTPGNWSAGKAVLMDTDATSGTRYEARHITAVNTSASTLTLDRNTTGAPANGATLYASWSYPIDPDLATISKYIEAKAEGENWMRRYQGCAAKCTFSFPPGGLAAANWELMPNTWTDVAEENPTYSAPTTSSALVVMGSPFWVANTQTSLIDGTIDVGVEPQQRTATEGTNGYSGFHRTYTGVKFQGRIFYSDATVATMQGNNTLSLGLQIGDTSSSSTPGNCFYFYIPALAVDNVQMEEFNGVDVINFSGVATRPTSGAPFYIHVFGGNYTRVAAA